MLMNVDSERVYENVSGCGDNIRSISVLSRIN